MTNIHYKPGLSPEKIRENLFRLIAPGEIRDKEIQRRISRLGERFRVYASTCPLGLWAPGLAVSREMRSITELYLPIAEIADVFDRFLSLSLMFSLPTKLTPIHTSATWLDALNHLQHYVNRSDPAALLQRLMMDESFRIGFLFALFLPDRHGGGFNRYPGQWEFLQSWLPERKEQCGTGLLRCLDSACATGESTYELAMLLTDIGLQPDSFVIHGSTLEPLELFSAAHIFFPHDRKRQASFRRKAEPVFDRGAENGIEYFTEDITLPFGAEKEGYDIILCNGLLGGPQFHDEDRIAEVVSNLRERLRDGGIILAADRFHGGWKKLVPDSLLREIFRKYGFHVQEISDGFVAQKKKH
jgi:chemotaxis methyl-accepting protein methylase